MDTTQTRDLDLAGHRMAKGISLSWIESSTRIGLHFLQAIEAEEFDKLPGGVYSLSYLRQYARAIGFDESVLLGRYRKKMEPEPFAEPASHRVWFVRLLFDRLEKMPTGN
jgi:cytoskeletal protein RodZ